MKVKRYEIEYEDDVNLEISHITQEEYNKLLLDDLFCVNRLALRTIYEVKEERWLCQTPNAVGKKLGVEYVIRP